MVRLLHSLIKNPINILWLYLCIINLVTFILMGIDKRKAIRGSWRIPERRLFLFAAIGGSIGGILGIYLFRHKTLHKKFTYGYPAILIAQVIISCFLYFRL